MKSKFIGSILLLSALYVISPFELKASATGYTNNYSETGSAYYNNGVKFLKSSSYDNAIIEFKKALRENPTDKSSRIQLVNSYIARAQYNNNKVMDYNKTANDLRSALFYLRFYDEQPVDVQYLSDVNNLEATLDNILYSMNVDKSAKGRCTMGRSLRAQGEFAAAATEFHKSIQADISCKKTALANLGEIYLILNLHTQAVKYLDEALSYDSDNATLRLKLASAYERLGKIDLAAEQYNLALEKSQNNEDVLSALENLWRHKIEINPNDAEAHANLGAVYQRKKNYVGALAQYEKAEKLNPSNVNTRLNLGTLYQVQKEYETAIAAYDTILDVNPNFKLAYLYKAQCYKALGNKDAALENYKLALNLDPNNFEIKNEISSLYEENMTPEQKLAHYYAQLQQDQTNEELVYKYAYELHKVGKLNDSILYYEQSIKLNPKNEDAYINLAQAYKQQKKYDKAQSCLTDAKSLFPENKTIKNQLLSLEAEKTSLLYSDASNLYGEKKYLEAISLYKQIQPETPESLLGIGACYQALSNFSEAAEYYVKSLEKDANNSETAYYAALAYSNAEDFEKAKVYAKRTLVIDPNNKNAKELIAYVVEQENVMKMDKAIELFEKEDYSKALLLLSEILNQDKTDSNAYYYRAMIYDVQKQYLKAINDYKKALEYNSQMLIAYYAIAVDYDYLAQYSNALIYHKKYIQETQKVGETNDYTRYSANRIQDLKAYETKPATKQ